MIINLFFRSLTKRKLTICHELNCFVRHFRDILIFLCIGNLEIGKSHFSKINNTILQFSVFKNRFSILSDVLSLKNLILCYCSHHALCKTKI